MRPWLHKIERQLLRAMLVTAAVGVVLVSLPPFAWLSYDVAYLDPLRPQTTLTEIAVIYANETTVRNLGDGRDRVSWTNHARLLDRLTQDGARLVFYDLMFTETNPVPELNQALARAMKRQGSVILVAPVTVRDEPGIHVEHVEALPAPIADAAKGSGHGELFENVVRKLPRDFAGETSAVWAAAAQLDPERFGGQNPNLERWLNYYGLPPTAGLPTFLFDEVVSNAVPPGFFTQKIVFVGAALPADGARSYKDTFATPYTLFRQKPMPGVAIHATALLNLLRDEWLRALPLGWQWLAAVIWGAIITTALFSLSRKPKTVLILAAVLGAGALCAVSLFVQWHAYWWWSWIGPVLGQTSVALLYVARHPKADPYIAFISYRTEDDGAAALLIAKSLSEQGHKTFIDVRSLTAGPFDEQLLHEIENATFFILILSPTSLARCMEEDDWVLKELAHALSNKKQIIPVFKGRFSFDAKEGIPDLLQIRELRKYQGVAYSNTNFEGFMQRLVELLKLRQ